MVLDLAPYRVLARNAKIALEQTKVSYAQLAKSRERFTTLCHERELSANRTIIFGGERSDDNVARVDANEPRAAVDIKISVNEIGRKETMLKEDSHLCEALNQRPGSDGKEIVCRGGHHLDEALIYQFAVRVQSKRGKATVQNGSSLGSLE
ncbi:unnamed protein product [Linum trigynum]|uniref:Uncharacterized protein n=1 Tax=Linum trigynum TaxID=586398 RepID=A0AAV2GM44_9ROSI